MMKYFLLMVLFLLAILFLKVTIKLQFHEAGKQSVTRMKVSILGGLLRYKMSFNLRLNTKKMSVGVKEKSESVGGQEQHQERFTAERLLRDLLHFRAWLIRTNNLAGLVLRFTRGVQVRSLEIEAHYGQGDAAKTARRIGVFWGMVGNFLSVYQSVFDSRTEPCVEFIPYFFEKRADFKITGIFEFRVGHLIWVGIQFIRAWTGRKIFFFVPVLKKRGKMT